VSDAGSAADPVSAARGSNVRRPSACAVSTGWSLISSLLPSAETECSTS
jgi:hypothetical protein